jgi:hypothetical protein
MSQQQNFNGFSSPAQSGVLQIGVDAHTAPGTDPVVPNGSGQIDVTGGQVAAGTTTNVIRTDSLAASTFTIEIQRSQAIDISTVGDNGVCHFDSADFTVDSNGFVQLNSSVVDQWIVENTDVASAAARTGYFADGATGPTGITVTLPATAAVGYTFKVYNFNGAGFVIAQRAGQSIQIAEQLTSTGTGGNIISTQIGDTIELVCSVANTQWAAVNFAGNFIIN